MDAQEHRGQWFAFGGVLFAGGIVIWADWIFAVRASAPQNHLSYSQAVILIPIILIGAGVYVMAAANIENWPLPGKKRVRFFRGQRSAAIDLLSMFHLMGSTMAAELPVVDDDVKEWGKNLAEYVRAVWGNAEGAALVAIGLREQGPDLLSHLLEALDGLIKRSSILRVSEDYDPNKPVSWAPYVYRIQRERFGDG